MNLMTAAAHQSSPKYWCKHCKTYVRDSKLEKSQHEATPKHQGNLKRFLRDLHRGHEREERDKQRAKTEVERLNGVVTGGTSSSSAAVESPWKRKSVLPPTSTSVNQQVSVTERNAQMKRLAEMGVAIPEEFRREMAMAGDWQIMSERIIDPSGVKKEEEHDEDIKPDVLSIGVRKRKHDGRDEGDEAGESNTKKGWGSRIKTCPGQGDGDLEALLGAGQSFGSKREETIPSAEGSSTGRPTTGVAAAPPIDMLKDGPGIKREESDGNSLTSTLPPADDINIKAEDGEGEVDFSGEPRVIFKKRKAKNIRQR
ncbi:MAG: hypothetical protein M1812_005364 [Candelaria pacifica]|nr:MAG: hypothetical protein M1812_005364 [Candelaria pacifica]